MAQRTVSEPVRLLVAFLNEHEPIEVTPRRIERWRQRGLIPQATWSGGDGTGSHPTYRPPYLQGLAAARAVRTHPDLNHAVIALWADGWDMEPRHLRSAALAWLENQEDRYQREFSGDPEAAASATAFTIARHPVGRLWMSRLPSGEDQYRGLVDGLEQGFRLGFGEEGDPPDAPDEFRAFGNLATLLDAASEYLGDPFPDDLLMTPLPTSMGDKLARAVRDALPVDWENARTLGSVQLSIVGNSDEFRASFVRGLWSLALLLQIHREPFRSATPYIVELLMTA